MRWNSACAPPLDVHVRVILLFPHRSLDYALGAERARTRVETVTETLRHALNILATRAPDWLRSHTAPEWVERYCLRASEYRLPKSQAERQAWAEQVGHDGQDLLTALYREPTPSDLRSLRAVETL
jgi:hypothetical protein